MPTHAENIADPSMIFIELGGKREWVKRSRVRGLSRDRVELHIPGRQSVGLKKNPNLMRTFADPEYIEVKGGGSDPSPRPRPHIPPLGACCFNPPGQKRFCRKLTQAVCKQTGGVWLGAGTECVIDPFDPDGGLVCPEAPGGGMDPVSLASQSVDLNSAGAEMLNPWLVHESQRLTIQATLPSGSWNTAEVQVRGSIDNASWTVIKTLTGIGLFKAIDVENYTRVQIRVSVVEGAAGTARFSGYGKLAMTSWG